MSKLILEQETHRILGACFEVYGLLINFSHYPGVEHERFVI